MKLLYAGRDRSALGRPGISFKPEIKDPMRCGRQLGKKAVIVRGIRGGEVDDAHVGLREYLASLRAQVDPAQLLALKQIAQSPRPDNLGEFVWADRARRGGSQNIDHLAAEDLAGPDIAGRS